MVEIITCWVSDHFLEYNSWTIFHPGIAPSSDIRRKAPPKGMEMSPHFPHTLSKASLLLMPYVWHHIRVGFKSSNVSSLVCDKTTNYVHIFVCINISCMLFFSFLGPRGPLGTPLFVRLSVRSSRSKNHL